MKLEMLRTNEKKNVRVLEKIEGTQLQMTAEFPVVVQILGGRMIKARYDSAEWADRSVKCTAHIKDTGSMEMEETDLWTVEEACVQLERTVRWISGESAVRLHTSFACTDGKAESFDDSCWAE